MLKGNPDTLRIAARVREYLAPKAPWNRRLWSVGSCLALHEFLEALEATAKGILHREAVANLANSLEVSVARDPGIGDQGRRRLVQGYLRSKTLRPSGLPAAALRQLTDDIERDYLARWADELRAGQIRVSVERAARGIASHMLDHGFSGAFLHEWWSARLSRRSSGIELCDLLLDAQYLLKQPLKVFQVLVAFDSIPRGTGAGNPHWLTARGASRWLREQGAKTAGLRIQGGLLLDIRAPDKYAAVERVREIVDHLRARAAVGSEDRVGVIPQIGLAGESACFPLERPRRGVDVHSLDRENIVFALPTEMEMIDHAIELLGVLDRGAPGPAVMCGWAVIESLLTGEGEGVERVAAADRMASIVACSFPRAELTTLGYRHARSAGDSLADQIQDASSNKERASLVADYLRGAGSLVLRTRTDEIAEARMKKLLASPSSVMSDLTKHISATMRRLYRQRNLVVHGGKTDAVALKGSLRVTAPLVGAGVDRLAHAAFREGTRPMNLAARAMNGLALLDTMHCRPVTELLEP